MAGSLSDIARRVIKINNKVNKQTASRIIAAKAKSKIIGKSPRVAKPKDVVKAKGLTLSQLLNNCLASRRANAVRDKVKIVTFAVNPEKTKIRSRSLTYDNTTNRKPRVRPHKHWVTKVINDVGDELKPFSNSRIKVQCDCITGDTKVLTGEGWKKAVDIAQPQKSGHYPLDYLVNGVLYKGSFPYPKGKQNVWKVSFTNGLDIKVTENQKFLVQYRASTSLWRGSKYYKTENKMINRWVKLKNLLVKDQVVMPNYDTPEIIYNQEFYEAFFIGVLMGDGSIFSNGTPDLQLFKKDNLEIITMLRNAGVVKKIITLPTKKNGLRVRFKIAKACRIMQAYKFVNKKSVNISNRTQLIGYLSGLLITDGYLGAREAGIYGAKPYLKQLFDWLIEYGYPYATLRISRKKGTETNLGIATKDMYKLYISVISLAKMQNSLYLTENKQKTFQNILTRIPQKCQPYAIVKSISYVGEREVFDITVPTIERFVANGLVMHNCEDQMYSFEYALHHYNAADIKFCNNEYPYIKNAKLYPGICKHLFVLLKYIRNENI